MQNSLILDNALAIIGVGLPSAIMAKELYPNKKVISRNGDGGFMMNSQEIETAVRLKLDLVVIILNVIGNNYEIEESQYIPELITINDIGSSFDESINSYRVNKNNLSIEYNTDIKNKNGVALLILWDGTTQDRSVVGKHEHGI